MSRQLVNYNLDLNIPDGTFEPTCGARIEPASKDPTPHGFINVHTGEVSYSLILTTDGRVIQSK